MRNVFVLAGGVRVSLAAFLVRLATLQLEKRREFEDGDAVRRKPQRISDQQLDGKLEGRDQQFVSRRRRFPKFK